MVLLTDKPLKISRESYIEPARRGGLFVFGLSALLVELSSGRL